MLLIWGWRSFMKVVGAGEFHCPRCDADLPYRLLHPRRWFTLFFIPVIPLKWGERFVECGYCKGAYVEAVLTSPTTTQLDYMLGLGVRAMYGKAVHAAFTHREDRIEQAAAYVRAVTSDPGYNEANVLADAATFGPLELTEYVGPLADHITVHGREGLITDLVAFVHGPDGERNPAAEQVVTEAAAAMQLSVAHLAGIVAGAAVTDLPH